MNTYEGSRRSRNEDADLVDDGVGTVERAIFGEWRIAERKEKGGRYALVDGVFSNIDKQKREHATNR